MSLRLHEELDDLQLPGDALDVLMKQAADNYLIATIGWHFVVEIKKGNQFLFKGNIAKAICWMDGFIEGRKN